jgi:hypothetical protein
MDLATFLTWLGSAGGAAAVFSFIAERIPALQEWTPLERSLLHLVGSLGIALAAYAVLTYVPPDTLAQLAPAFQLVYGVAAAWLANQIAHTNDPLASKYMAHERPENQADPQP